MKVQTLANGFTTSTHRASHLTVQILIVKQPGFFILKVSQCDIPHPHQGYATKNTTPKIIHQSLSLHPLMNPLSRAEVYTALPEHISDLAVVRHTK